MLDEMVRRIVAAAHPLKVILFGSAARGTMGPDSDVDLLVVVPDGTQPRKMAQELYRRLYDVGIAKDIIVVTQSDVNEHADYIGSVIRPALAEGRVLYGAA
jgi:predicted nucleotidyltransferase